MNLFKKPKLEFYSTIKGVHKLMPIVEAKTISYDWVKKAGKHFADSNRSTTRCPGIFAAKNEGWILRSWQDIVLNVDGDKYKWETPMNQDKLSEEFSGHAVSEHDASMMHQFFDNWPEGSLPSVLKFNTPWLAKIPKGYILKQFHPPYLDENRFTTLSGIYSPEYGMATLHIPVIWHKQGESLIKAGTPLAQFSLHKKEEIDFSVDSLYNNMGAWEDFALQNLGYNSTLKREYFKIKNLISK